MYNEKAWKPELPSLRDWDIKMHDFVEVNKGPQKGARGRVIERQFIRNNVVVEGVKVKEKPVLDGESHPFAPKFKTESTPQPIYFRDVSLVDPILDRRVAGVRWERNAETKRMQRVSPESGNVIPLPARPEPEPVDYAPSLCTPGHSVLEVTYIPLPEEHQGIARRRRWEATLQARGAAAPASDGATPQAAPTTGE